MNDPKLTAIPVADAIAAQLHLVELPVMCPFARVPGPGSYLAVRYTPAGKVLEVDSLHTYLANCVGGWLRENGEYVRDIERIVALAAQECADVLGVRVRMRARVVLPHSGALCSSVAAAPTRPALTEALRLEARDAIHEAISRALREQHQVVTVPFDGGRVEACDQLDSSRAAIYLAGVEPAVLAVRVDADLAHALLDLRSALSAAA